MKNEKTVIRGVLEEELERNYRMINRYTKELDDLPKGSIIKRKMGNQEYYYITYRENKKVISKYIGKVTEIDIDEIVQRVKKRKYIENILKNLKLEEKQIKKALK